MRHKMLVPEYLEKMLQDLGLKEENVFWQHATDFLRETFGTHIVIWPVQTLTPPYYVFDYSLISPYGEDWDKEMAFIDYYEALEDAILESINCINEGHGTAGSDIRQAEIPAVQKSVQVGGKE